MPAPTVFNHMIRSFIAAACVMAASLEVRAVTVITWNVWNGFEGGKSRDAAAAWLASRAPDIVALQELNGQTGQSLSELAKRWEHPHAVILKKDGYPVGLTSRTPIEGVVRHREGLSHGCLQARTGGWDIFVVHLHPGDCRIRENEMRRLTAVIRPLLAEKRRVLVLGDFNSHSPVDRSFLARQTKLLEKRRGPNLRDGAFDFSVMEGFLGCGLRDLSVAKAPANRTFPTRVLAESASADDQAGLWERIDFVLADPHSAAACRGLRYPADEVLDRISDHYPVEARF